MRPRLLPHARPLDRCPGEVQIGLDPGDALVVSGLPGAALDLLGRLDGTRDLATLRRLAGRVGIGARDWDTLIDALVARGLVEDAGASAPDCGRVVVDGQGATTAALVGLLRAAGIVAYGGRAAADDADLAARAGVEDLPDVVVRVAAGALSPVGTWWRSEVPVLPVVLRSRSVSVGPLVRPPGPCLYCLDLARTDSDCRWPRILAQVGHELEPASPTPLTAVAAGLASAVVLEFLRRGDDEIRHGPAEGAVAPRLARSAHESLEYAGDPPRLTGRRWIRHPDCDRHPDAVTMG